jgi:acetyl coenzyme A synthetase (ADP forming)-like protein
MESLLDPRSVAVIGASRNPSSLGRRVFDALRSAGFGGAIYPVNAQSVEIGGMRCYRSARDLPPGVDLAVISVPTSQVLAAADDAIAAGVRALVVITAGFAETGPEGAELQRALAAKVQAAGVRMVGPNCLGLINTKSNLNASFSPIVPPRGRVALSSQSGALGLTVLELARDRGLGLSTFVSIGNKANVSSNDLLEFWEQDPETSVIALYMESFGNPRKFAELSRRIGRTKPIVAVKSGRTRAGGRAASSHTAALAASDEVVDALFEASGVIRADTIDEMFDVAACVATQALPAGRRIAIVTNAGGPGILAVDACERGGLQVVEFAAGTRAKLKTFLNAAASVGNPVDMVASAGADAYRQALETVLAADEVDAVIVIHTPVDPGQSRAIVDGIRAGIAGARAAGNHKTVLACLMTDAARPQPLLVGGERVPVYVFPENAARALSKVTRYAEWRNGDFAPATRFPDVLTEQARSLSANVLAARGEDWLTAQELRQLLASYGIAITPGATVTTPDAALEYARELGYPVVAKLNARQLVHKSDVEGVRVGIEDDDEMRAAFAALMETGRHLSLTDASVLIQPMAARGVEMMVGVAHDRLFGAVVGFGRGGTDVEIERDVHFRVAPLSERDADALIRQSRAMPRLVGYRGRPPADVAALRELLLRVSQLVSDVPAIAEMDLNPVIALPAGEGCAIVDARVRLAMPGPAAAAG